jgi:hypothetical protein
VALDPVLKDPLASIIMEKNRPFRIVDAMTRAKIIAIALPPALALIALFFGLRIHAELARGQQVFWLAELWSPAAVMTIVVVVCIDLLVPPRPPSGGAARPKARPRSAA